MEREDANELWQIIKAYGEGKDIQFQTADGTWVDNEDMDITPNWKYRIKPEEPKYRAFKSCDELIEKWNKDICPHIQPKNTMPLIWVMDKVYSKGDTELITGYTKVGNVLINGTNFPLQSLFECYTFLDGTPCGVEE